MARTPWPELPSYPAEPDPTLELRVAIDRRRAVLWSVSGLLLAAFLLALPVLAFILVVEHGAGLDQDESSCAGRAREACGP